MWSVGWCGLCMTCNHNTYLHYIHVGSSRSTGICVLLSCKGNNQI